MATPQNGGFGNVQLPEGFSEKELKWSYWWVEHKEQVRKFGIAVFLVVDAAMLLFALWGIIDWLVLSGTNEDKALRSFAGATYGKLSGGAGAEEIKLDAPIVFSGVGDKVDVIDSVTNPNADYWIELTYAFSAGDAVTPARKAAVLPGETKFLSELGAPLGGHSSEIRLVVTKRAFHHVDKHEIPDVAKWLQSRLDLPVTDQKFIAADAAATVATTITRFNIRNNTAYSYYDVDLLVLAYRGDGLVGANTTRLSRFSSGETRGVDLYWYQNLPQITSVVVQPNINLFDPSVYKPAGQ